MKLRAKPKLLPCPSQTSCTRQKVPDKVHQCLNWGGEKILRAWSKIKMDEETMLEEWVAAVNPCVTVGKPRN